MNIISRQTHTNHQEVLQMLCLGDSYTIGEGIEQGKTWPFLLKEKLNVAGIKMNDPEIIARTGWTTGELLQALEEKNIRKEFDVVTLLIGANNQFRGYSLDIFSEELEKLIQQAVRLAGTRKERVFLISIPDWSTTPFAEDRDRRKISSEIVLFNEEQKKLAQKYELTYINIFDLSGSLSSDSSMLAEDGLHPSGRQYERWTEVMLPALRDKLTSYG